MGATGALAELSPAARRTFAASFLGWTLDAFDFFLLTLALSRIAVDFRAGIAGVAFAITLTLMCRPLGALLFGWLGDRYGRRTPLMIDIALYSLIELLTAFSPNFTIFLALRALYGIAMGGEWGLGAAMAMEVLPPKQRGLFSGILQEGYAVGYLLAALAAFLVFAFTPWGWRGLFVVGVLPGLLIFYIRARVPESPAFRSPRAPLAPLTALARNWPLVLYAVFFMASLNVLSHGTQDLYPVFVQKQRGFDPSAFLVVAAIGAIAGGTLFGWLSQRFGRRACILVCALLGVCAIPLWVFSPSLVLLALGAFAMQFIVQAIWGIVPAHLNELSPAGTRGTFPGFTYQLGNLIAAGTAQTEAALAARHFPLPGSGGPDYAKAMAIFVVAAFACVFVFTAIGYAIKREGRDEPLAATPVIS